MRSLRWRLRASVRGAALGLTLLPLAVAAAQPGIRTPSIFDPSSTPAHGVLELSYLVIGVCFAIFVLVTALLTSWAVLATALWVAGLWILFQPMELRGMAMG